jgi:hypothetical protein
MTGVPRETEADSHISTTGGVFHVPRGSPTVRGVSMGDDEVRIIVVETMASIEIIFKNISVHNYFHGPILPDKIDIISRTACFHLARRRYF